MKLRVNQRAAREEGVDLHAAAAWYAARGIELEVYDDSVTQVCLVCREHRDLADFASSRPGRYGAVCVICRPRGDGGPTRRCRSCRSEKPLTEEHFARGYAPNGRATRWHARCRSCEEETSAQAAERRS